MIQGQYLSSGQGEEHLTGWPNKIDYIDSLYLYRDFSMNWIKFYKLAALLWLHLVFEKHPAMKEAFRFHFSSVLTCETSMKYFHKLTIQFVHDIYYLNSWKKEPGRHWLLRLIMSFGTLFPQLYTWVKEVSINLNIKVQANWVCSEFLLRLLIHEGSFLWSYMLKELRELTVFILFFIRAIISPWVLNL